MGKIHIFALLIIVIHVSHSREIDVCVNQDIGWTKVKEGNPMDFCQIHFPYSLNYS